MGRRKKKRYQLAEFYALSPETKKGIFIIFLFAISILSILGFLGLAGKAGIYIDWGLSLAFGIGRYAVPFILILLGYVLARPSRYELSIPNYLGILVFVYSLFALMHIREPFKPVFEIPFTGTGGGFTGYLAGYPVFLYLGFWGGLITLIALLIISLLLMFNTSIESILGKINIFRLFSRIKDENEEEEYEDDDDEEYEDEDEDEDEDEEYEDETEDKEVESTPTQPAPAPQAPAPTLSDNDLPGKRIVAPKIKVDIPLSLLDKAGGKPSTGDLQAGMDKIEKTLKNFNIEVEMDGVRVGPTVTQYTLKPSQGVKLSRITALSNDLALALAAHPIRIEAPIPGKSLVGIEVPNTKAATVKIREIMQSKSFKTRDSNLHMVLGKDVGGKCWTYNLAKMPHLLVAGSTGSGKSVCLNNIIISLLYQNNPDSLRLILVDPKRVEFPIYNGIPHLLTPVITDVTKTVNALKWAITEMDSRFDTLSKVNKRNIEDYNKYVSKSDKLPYIVIIIDELADLMIAAAAEVENSIIRLTQMARAVGIHLIVATQRPSVDVITGLIKANIPSRIAFSVASLMDSRTILDSSGAEKLIGRGDMLFLTPAINTQHRIQGAFLSDDEVRKVVKFLKNASQGETAYIEDVTEKRTGAGGTKDFSGDHGDDLFEDAKATVIQSGKASASLLQRRLRVGYARAARLIDLLEEAGIVGPAEGAKPREILIDPNAPESVPSFEENRPDPAKDYSATALQMNHSDEDSSGEEDENLDEEDYNQEEEDLDENNNDESDNEDDETEENANDQYEEDDEDEFDEEDEENDNDNDETDDEDGETEESEDDKNDYNYEESDDNDETFDEKSPKQFPKRKSSAEDEIY